MKERITNREVKTKVHVVETGNFIVEVLEDERGELHIRRRKVEDDPAENKFAWKYSNGNGSWGGDSYWGDTVSLAKRADGWSPDFDG